MRTNTSSKTLIVSVLVVVCLSAPLLANEYPHIVTVDAKEDTSPSFWYGTDYRICESIPCDLYHHASQPLPTNPWGGEVKKYHFDPGFYRIAVADGAANQWVAGPTWNWHLQIYVEGDGRGYMLGNNRFYDTPEDALAANSDRYVIINVETPGDVWFWYGDSTSGDNQGFLTAGVDTFSVGDCIELVKSQYCSNLKGRDMADCLLAVTRFCRNRYGN